MRSIRSSLVVILILTVVCVALWAYVSSISSRSDISAEQLESTESFEDSEDNIPYMSVTNQELLYEVFPSIAPTVINQVYVQNYQKDGRIDRYATIEGDVVQNNRTYAFTIHFIESGIKRNVTVTMINESTGNYDITVGDKL